MIGILSNLVDKKEEVEKIDRNNNEKRKKAKRRKEEKMKKKQEKWTWSMIKLAFHIKIKMRIN